MTVDLNLIYLGSLAGFCFINFIVFLVNIFKGKTLRNEFSMLNQKRERLAKEQEYLDTLYSQFHKDKENYLRLTRQLEERQRREMERKRGELKHE